MENRIHVLMRLAEKTAHRDTLEVLCNLPGIKEPHGEGLKIKKSSVFFLI